MALAALATFVELFLLCLLILPLGTSVLWAGEWLARHRVALFPLERALIAFYLGGAVFFVVASLPIPIFGLTLVIGLILVGFVSCLSLWVVGRPRSPPSRGRRLPTAPFVLVGLGTLGLLAYFVLVIGGNLLPNTYDGSVQTIFVVLLLRNHTVPSTLSPFAAAGVVYPQGTAVWLGLPVLLFSWPSALSPVLLPPLFLALSVPAAYCWGARWSGGEGGRGTVGGLLFAAFFGLVGAWPRLLVGGSYDFVFAVPLAMVVIGGLPTWLARKPRPWSEVLALGVVLGVVSSMSVAVGEALVVLLLSFLLLLHRPWRSGTLTAWLARVAAAVGVGCLFLVRSLAGILLWFSYPGHVLTETGSHPFAPPPVTSPLSWGVLLGQLDPFVIWDPKVSPAPFLDLELLLLLLGGLATLWVLWGSRAGIVRRWIPDSLWKPTVAGTMALFVLTAVLVVSTASGSPVQGIGAISSVIESSIFLFMFYQVLALIPLCAAASYLGGSRTTPASDVARSPPSPPGQAETYRHTVRPRPDRRVITLALAILVALPFASGLVVTVGALPGYLHTETVSLANVSQGDLDALGWAGSHLPACSSILIAPGSAAQFLPAYGTFKVDYPMNPAPRNLSYFVAVTNLTDGSYTAMTRSALLNLGITQVFVTAASTKLNPPFELPPIEHSSDFSPLFTSGDAGVFAFLPGQALTGCSS
ncbi:MAG: hypothetical protein WCA77_00230 [Thermoplasmata archaeon]